MNHSRQTVRIGVAWTQCLLLLLLQFGFASRSEGQDQKVTADQSPRIVNIINFIRQTEPRIDWITDDVLYETVVEQIRIMKRHDLKGTFLLQYDALITDRYQELLKELPSEQFEIGAWWEIPQPLVEDSGYKWRGRYSWDWHADVGFATGYSPKEREKLVDTYMAKFKGIFGSYPKSVGSWFIDAHTLNYMYEKYGIVASCNCKDQVGTDGYTLWGGYWNQAYYPSKLNAFMPAQNVDNQISVPIFRMLGSDPIYQYDSGLGQNRQRVTSLEPVYRHAGGNAEWCQWYFDTFVEGTALGFGYVQAGQENSFTWKKMRDGFEIQMPMIERLAKEGKVNVQTLSETGRWFKQEYEVTPPTSVTVLKDYSEKDLKSVWFNSRFYRANLLWGNGTVRFRDIHLFDERLTSRYLKEKGTSSQCLYHTLPLVDGFNWSSVNTTAGLRFKNPDGSEIKMGEPKVRSDDGNQLVVVWPLSSNEGSFMIKMDETTLNIIATGNNTTKWLLELTHASEAKLPFTVFSPNRVTCSFNDFVYPIELNQGEFQKLQAGFQILPEDKCIEMNLSVREPTK